MRWRGWVAPLALGFIGSVLIVIVAVGPVLIVEALLKDRRHPALYDR